RAPEGRSESVAAIVDVVLVMVVAIVKPGAVARKRDGRSPAPLGKRAETTRSRLRCAPGRRRTARSPECQGEARGPGAYLAKMIDDSPRGKDEKALGSPCFSAAGA